LRAPCEVSRHAGQAARAGLPSAPGPAGEVGDFALCDGPVGLVALLSRQVTLGGAGTLQHCLMRLDGEGAAAVTRRIVVNVEDADHDRGLKPPKFEFLQHGICKASQRASLHVASVD
jgi:hypothetical protein